MSAFPAEAVRFAGEPPAALALAGLPWLGPLVEAARTQGPPDPTRIRRGLMASSLQLSESMAPDTWADARRAAAALGVQGELLIFQSAGSENALIHLVAEPIFLEIRGRLLSLLDSDSRLALFGHELGHWLAHGPASPDGALGPVANAVIARAVQSLGSPPPEALRHASALSMAREITADRYGLLASGSLDACLRLEMATTTGLSAGDLSWDTKSYLEQCKALAEQALAEGESAWGLSHPEHGLRAWAIWLWSESDRYRELTGLGPGSRPIAEVEAAIGKVLGAAPAEGLSESALRLDPIPEVHECALAAAALVALADGELSEAELLAIEGVFASLVPDWQRYLNRDNALEAFYDTGAVVTRGGTSTQKAVFQVLAHVLAADAIVHEAEIEMICSIGDALRAGPLFRALLEPVLRSLGHPTEILGAPITALPLPARPEETHSALRVLLSGVLRRRGGEVSPRLLYRLQGLEEGNEAARLAVEALCGELELHLDPPRAEGLALVLASQDLDRPLRLLPSPAALGRLDAQSRPPLPDLAEPSRQRLTRALSRLRDQLVSGDGRSPSIRLRTCRRGRALDLHALERISLGHADRVLALARSGQRARLVDGREVAGHDAAAFVSAELLALHREALARFEETGARDLFLGAPFLVGVIGGYLLRGPLILIPVELDRGAGGGFSLRPRPDEPPVANQALLRLLFTRRGLPFPDELAEQLDQAAADGEESLLGLLAEHAVLTEAEGQALGPFLPRDEDFVSWADRRLVREAVAVLGFFPQSSSDMIQDYDALLAAVSRPGEDLARRFGAAGALLPADLREALGVSPLDPNTEAPPIPVVAADPSQLQVLEAARSTRALVVDGPPGTGKSQVIVNLVVDALARGQQVAVVCEKRAALDVVAQRLEGVGLRHLLAVVHDVHDDRRPLYEQVVRRLGEGALRQEEEAERSRVEEERAAVEASLQARRAALATAFGDKQAALGEELPGLGSLHVLASSFTTPALSPLDPSLVRLPHRELRRLAERVGREARNVDLHGAGSPWRAPDGSSRPSLAEVDGAGLLALEQRIEASREAAAALDASRQAQGTHEDPVRPAEALIQAAIASRPGRADPFTAHCLAAWLSHAENPQLPSLAEQLRLAWEGSEAWSGELPERVEFPASPELEQALTVVQRGGVSIFRFLSPQWWSARGLLRSLLSRFWPGGQVFPTAPLLAGKVQQRTAATAAWAALDRCVQALGLEVQLADSATATGAARALLAAWEQARPLVEGCQLLRAAGAWPEEPRLTAWEARLDARARLLAQAHTLSETFAPVRAWLPWWPPCPSGAELEALHQAWAMEAPRVALSDRAMDATLPLARGLVQRLADDSSRPAEELAWAEAVEHGWARLGIEAIERRQPGVRGLDRPTPHGEVAEAEARLSELSEDRGRLHVLQVLARCDRLPLLTEARPDQRKRRTELQRGRELMLREATKRRNVLSLRGYVRQFSPLGLLQALPVWLVSPETMAILFPGEPVFDLVIMDEASQATVEKGLPALVRGRRAVVAGDERQMPPSRFFELRTEGEDEPGTEQTVAADALTAESLLVLARERCPHRGLRWHYRCLYEELIAFSNHAMYGGELFTIPSTHTPRATPAMRWVAVPDGAYEAGVNRIEANAVVEELARSMREHPALSLGVITFNVQQQRAIQDAIDARCGADPEFSAAWSSAIALDELDRRPFIKNLESVQGDERDVILFSLGHAPIERRTGPLKGQRTVPARFGPLGQTGGERRLNVAVSRARQACVIVSSFEPAMLSVAESKNEGPRLLKAFLEYAWELTRGQRHQAERTLHRVRSGSLGAVAQGPARPSLGAPSLASQIALALEERGVGYDLDVGSSGFRVPLAIQDAQDPTRWTVAVLTDEGLGAEDVDEAHCHRPSVLRARGWQVLRVDARSWDRDRGAVLRRLLAALPVRQDAS